MSTANKTDPVRATGKQRRLDAVKMFRRAAVQHRGSLTGEAYAAIAHKLEAVRKDPRLSGAEKERKFSRLIQSIAKI